MIALLYPWILAALPLPLLAWLALPAISAQAALPVPMAVRNLMISLSGSSERRPALPDDLWLKMLGWGLLVVALAGPHVRDVELLTPSGRDLAIAIDLSASMDEPDMVLDGVEVPRYIVVRRLLKEFIRGRKGDRVGLIAYGHEAYLVAPLSYDVEAVAAMLDELRIGLPGHRTDLGRAIGLAIKTFDATQTEARVLLLLSDGEDNSGALTGVDAAELAASRNIRIHTIGFASDIESDGAQILRDIATTSGGRFFWSKSSKDLGAAAQTIDTLEPAVRPEEEDQVLRDWTYWFLAAALMCLALLVVRELRRA